MIPGWLRGLYVEDARKECHLVGSDSASPRGARRRSSGSPVSVDLVIRGPIDPAAGRALVERVQDLADAGVPVPIVCNVAAVTSVDLATVEALARLQLEARRLGVAICLEGASPALRGLLAVVGLRDVVPCRPASGLEAGRQAEHREEALGVQEEDDPVDPTA